MKRGWLVLAVALAVLTPLSASADGRRHTVVIHPFVGSWYPPFAGAYWGPEWGPYWGPTWIPDPYVGMGVVKLETKVNDAQIYVNGGYLGTTEHNKTLHLNPGGYSIEVREAGREPFKANVYVAADRTVRLKPEF
jgi:hypothetical protein